MSASRNTAQRGTRRSVRNGKFSTIQDMIPDLVSNDLFNIDFSWHRMLTTEREQLAVRVASCKWSMTGDVEVTFVACVDRLEFKWAKRMIEDKAEVQLTYSVLSREPNTPDLEPKHSRWMCVKDAVIEHDVRSGSVGRYLTRKPSKEWKTEVYEKASPELRLLIEDSAEIKDLLVEVGNSVESTKAHSQCVYMKVTFCQPPEKPFKRNGNTGGLK